MNTMLSRLRELLKENASSFSFSYHRFLYILGYMDGIKSQKEFDWCSMTEEDINVLIKEATRFEES